MRSGVFLAGGLVAGLASTDDASAQPESEYRARIYRTDFYPGARFRVVSDTLDYRPNVQTPAGESFIADLYWNGYDTRIVRYGNTGERVLFFPPHEADVDRGDAYRFGQVRSTDELASGIVAVGVGQASDGAASDE